MRVVYVIGQPATGKTLLMRAFLSAYLGAPPYPLARYAKLRYVQVGPGIYVLGIYDRGIYAGTDRLSMAVQPDAVAFLRWMATQPGAARTVVAGEGDRLATPSFLDAAALICDLSVILLTASEATLAARHRGRADHQNAQWLRGRQTKLARLAARPGVEDFQHETPADTQRVLLRIQELVNATLGTP